MLNARDWLEVVTLAVAMAARQAVRADREQRDTTEEERAQVRDLLTRAAAMAEAWAERKAMSVRAPRGRTRPSSGHWPTL